MGGKWDIFCLRKSAQKLWTPATVTPNFSLAKMHQNPWNYWFVKIFDHFVSSVLIFTQPNFWAHLRCCRLYLSRSSVKVRSIGGSSSSSARTTEDETRITEGFLIKTSTSFWLFLVEICAKCSRSASRRRTRTEANFRAVFHNGTERKNPGNCF